MPADEEWNEAFARLDRGESSYRGEAGRLGVEPSTVMRRYWKYLESRIESLRRERAGLEGAVADARGKLDGLREEYERRETEERARLEQRLQDLRAEVEKARGQLEEIRRQRDELCAEAKKQGLSLGEALACIRRSSDLKGMVKALEEKHAKVSKLLAAARKRLGELERSAEEKRAEFCFYSSMTRQEIERYWNLKSQNDQLSQRVETFKKIVFVHELEEKIESLKREESGLREKINRLEAEARSLEDRISERREELKALEAREAEEREKLSSLCRQEEDKKRLIEALDEEIRSKRRIADGILSEAAETARVQVQARMAQAEAVAEEIVKKARQKARGSRLPRLEELLKLPELLEE